MRLKTDKINANQKRIANAWDDAAFTSEAIEAKRAEVRELQNALIKAQMELRAEVSKLPAVKELADENKTLNDEIKAMRAEFGPLREKLRIERMNRAANP